MISVSNDFKNAMKQPIKELEAFISGDIDIKSDDDLISFKISCESGLCKTAMRKLEAKYTGEHNLLGQWVRVGFGVKLADSTFEYLNYGSFLINEITTTKDTGVTTIVGYDKMIDSMTPYQKLDVEYPIRLIDYTKLLCEACNLELGNEGFTNNLYNLDLLSMISTYSESINADYYFGYKYQLSPNTTYTIKVTNNDYVGDWGWIYAICDSNKEFIARLQEGAKSEDITVTFTTDDTGVIYFATLYATQERLDNWFSKVTVQLEKGSSVSNYTKYNPMNDWLINSELWENIEGITYRDIFQQIAQATGTTCIISNDDKVYFKALTDTNEELTYDNMFKLKLEPKYGEINSVVLSRTPQEDNIFLRDEISVEENGVTEFKIENNEIVDKDRDNAITPIYEALRGISYYPFESSTEGLGWYEIGDNVNIINDTGDVFNTSLFNISIEIDGAIKETLKAVAETKTQTQYQYATSIAKRVKNTEIITNKQEQYIQQLVSDMYEENGVVNESFTKIYQDIANIVNTVQGSGGNNLIKNSVMFAYDNENKPNEWDIKPLNLFNVKDTYGISSTVTVDDSDFISINYDNTNGTSTVYPAIYTNISKDLETSTKYYLLIEIESVSGNGWIGFVTDNTSNNIGQFNSRISYDFVNLSAGQKIITEITTRDSFNECLSMLRTASSFNAGQKGSIKFRLSVLSKQENVDTFVYKKYTDGMLTIDSSTEALNSGSLSGHVFILEDKIASQKIFVKPNNTDSSELYYSFSTKIKKAITGKCHVRLYNSNEEHIIELGVGEESFYDEYEIKGLLPKDNYYIVEFYGSADSNATFTDNMLAIGEYKSQWTQANGEVMNTQVNISLDGILVKSSRYLGDYTVMSPLEFAGYSKINGTITKVFSLNKDTTQVKKLEAEDEVKMFPIKIVPVTSGELQGWAFVPATKEV